MKVAITGGSGFLGQYVVEECLRMGWHPVVLSRKKTNSEGFNSISTSYRLNDLSDTLQGFDAVVHLAASRAANEDIKNYHDNEVLTQNLYLACIENKIINVVYASSISVYSAQQFLPWSETQVLQPLNMYGISKMTNEYVGNYYSRQGGVCVKNLRLSHLFGYNEKNNYMINLFMRQAFRKERLTVYLPCDSIREFLYAKDAAKSIVNALLKEKLAGTFNISSGESFTNLEVAKMINQCFENDGNLEVLKGAPETVHSSYMNSRLASIKLGFECSYNMTSALKEIYHSMKGANQDVPTHY